MYDFTISKLGTAKIPSPLQAFYGDEANSLHFVQDTQDLIHYKAFDLPHDTMEFRPSDYLELAGPRKEIFFVPKHVHAGIVTCGGLCPGLNDVIREITRSLWYRYGVRRISGIRFGYKGLLPEYDLEIMELNPTVVDDIHRIGGSMLGSSRGSGERTEDIVDAIEGVNLNMLFCIGGDGTQKAAMSISQEIQNRQLKIAVVGIPKTIDNDLSFTERSFGFETAVSEATRAVYAAHAEAHSAINGIGLIKIMGRQSGYIAVHTMLASNETNFVLIPEVPFDLYAPNGFLVHLEKRLQRRQHAVIIVAEGAGQDMLPQREQQTDASGNIKLGDIGSFMKEKIIEYFHHKQIPINLKYLDPGYIIRSAVATASDSLYCSRLGHNAVHAAMAGKTALLIGQLNNRLVHVPMHLAVSERNQIDPAGPLWRDIIEATHQPANMCNSSHVAGQSDA